jgi:pyruvate formate lyase activating enzyme
MKIGAFQRFSLIEYPGKISAIIFCQGCNFRCPYCYNRELVIPALFQPLLSEGEILDFLAKRRGKLEAVTITGGEPALQPDLNSFISRLKEMEYLVKVDTNGSIPIVLEEWIESRLVDYIAMDIKGPLEKYGEITRSGIDPDKILQSIGILMASGVDYEFRTTVVQSLLTGDDILKIARLIAGAKRYALQRFLASKTLDDSFMDKRTFSDEAFDLLTAEIRPFVKSLILR